MTGEGSGATAEKDAEGAEGDGGLGHEPPPVDVGGKAVEVAPIQRYRHHLRRQRRRTIAGGVDDRVGRGRRDPMYVLSGSLSGGQELLSGLIKTPTRTCRKKYYFMLNKIINY